jgi:hypothetical protein
VSGDGGNCLARALAFTGQISTKTFRLRGSFKACRQAKALRRSRRGVPLDNVRLTGACIRRRRVGKRRAFAAEAHRQTDRKLGLTENRILEQPPLKSLHAESTLNSAKLQMFSRLSDSELVESLRPGQPGAPKTRPDGTLMDGHHPVKVLRDRGIPVDDLPRDVIPKDGEQGGSPR